MLAHDRTCNGFAFVFIMLLVGSYEVSWGDATQIKSKLSMTDATWV